MNLLNRCLEQALTENTLVLVVPQDSVVVAHIGVEVCGERIATSTLLVHDCHELTDCALESF